MLPHKLLIRNLRLSRTALNESEPRSGSWFVLIQQSGTGPKLRSERDPNGAEGCKKQRIVFDI